MLSHFFLGLCLLGPAQAAVTIYGQIPLAQTSTAAFDPAGTALPVLHLAAYNDTTLDPPPVPNPRPNTAFTLALQANGNAVQGLSIPQKGSFLGFSIEMSVISQVLGKNSSHLHVPFLNLMGNIQQRAGSINIRLGGNTQDFAIHVDELPNGAALGKEKLDLVTTTSTPSVLYTTDLFYMLTNVSSLVNVGWYLGIPFTNTSWVLTIAELGQEILGNHLLGLQAGNEPDYYGAHGHRPPEYSPDDYFTEFTSLVAAINNNPKIPIKNMLIGPSLATGPWRPENVWDTGYITAFDSSLSMLTVEHYPNNNCFEQFGVGTPQYPQVLFPGFLTHAAGQNLVRPYLNSSAIAQAAGKPFVMFETNTASCGGYFGISDSFGATLWALDYGMQMAHSNFSGALLHVGGQNVYYNPFTSPPTNQTSFNEWTIGAVYYSVLVMAEAFGSSNTSQIIDLLGNEANEFTPQYAIYERGQLSKIALFNYVDDPSGASDYVATINVAGGNVPRQVKVKYLASPSVSTKNNITWAGQTFGNKFEVDGRLKGQLNVVTIDCDAATNTCNVPVKAPGFALVFLGDSEVLTDGESEITFATTAHTKTINTATVDPSLLATSNGQSGKERQQLGSTSKGSINGATGLYTFLPGFTVLLAMVAGTMVVMSAR